MIKNHPNIKITEFPHEHEGENLNDRLIQIREEEEMKELYLSQEETVKEYDEQLICE